MGPFRPNMRLGCPDGRLGGLLGGCAAQTRGQLRPVANRPDGEGDQTAAGKEQLDRRIRPERPQTAGESGDPIDTRHNHSV